jgi:hypothetical protein
MIVFWVKALSGVNVGPESTTSTPAVAGLANERSAARAATNEQAANFFMMIFGLSFVSFSEEHVNNLSLPLHLVDAGGFWKLSALFSWPDDCFFLRYEDFSCSGT